MKRSIGLYIHWPYCLSKCPYCDFNSHVTDTLDVEKWIKAYKNAIDRYQYYFENRELVSIFFGGGTPSLMPVELVESVLNHIRLRAGGLPPEITLEANPTSVEASKFFSFRNLGINRLSLGIQALNDNDLKFLGRQHSASEALEALNLSRSVFERVSFDLIYTRPGQSLEDWEAELSEALSYDPDHLSMYQLTIERQTPFFQMHKRGVFQMPNDELAADLYEKTEVMISDKGLYSYEVSNYAVPGRECRHNLVYWEGEEYIGIGPGAHGRIISSDEQKDKSSGTESVWLATRQHRSPDIWSQKMSQGDKDVESAERIPNLERAREVLMMGLRLEKGIFFEKLTSIAGPEWQNVINIPAVQTLYDQGYMKPLDDRYALTVQGRLVLDSVLDFILKTRDVAA